MPTPPARNTGFQIPELPALQVVSLKRALVAIVAISTLAFAFLVWLIYLKPAAGHESPLISSLPAVNACLNALSTVLLLAGFVQIRRRNFQAHMRLMLSAFASSALFLVCYIVYHNSHGDTRFLASGWIRPLYFFILISHILLSAVALPLILTSLFLAVSGRLDIHRRVSRFTFPIWLYVSVTGVLVFTLLKLFNR